MDYSWCFVYWFCSGWERGTVGGVCCEEGSAHCVEGHGEDGEDEGDESPAGVEGRDDHGGRKWFGEVMKHSLGTPLMLAL